MIPCIRCLSELMAITESRDKREIVAENNATASSIMDTGQRKRKIKSAEKNEVILPNLPKLTRRKWIDNKESISQFFDDLDYNNQIQSTYDITLLATQENRNQQDVA